MSPFLLRPPRIGQERLMHCLNKRRQLARHLRPPVLGRLRLDGARLRRRRRHLRSPDKTRADAGMGMLAGRMKRGMR